MRRDLTWCGLFRDLAVLVGRPCQECNGAGGKIIFHFESSTASPDAVTKTPKFRRVPILGGIDVVSQIRIGRKRKASITPKDGKGNPTKFDGTPEWATDNTDLVALDVAADGLSCTITPLGVLGTCQVQVTADAREGSEVKPIIGTVSIEVTAGEAKVIEIVIGEEEDVPDEG